MRTDVRRFGVCAAVWLGLTMAGREALGQTSSPYVVPANPAVTTHSILTVGDSVGTYRMVGIPDGLGAFDNGDGTMTVLMNHELTSSDGIARLHNASLGAAGKGAFVSEWVIRKDTRQVLIGRDLILNVVLNGSTSLIFNRFCSADLPPVSAFFNASTGLGTSARIYTNGEETAGGRAFGHVATGANAFTSYELPLLGKFAHENVVANPFAQNRTIVAGTDDTTPQAPGQPTNNGGRIYIYVGTKTSTGSPVDMAGLTNGTNYAIQVAGVNLESRDFGLAAAGPAVTTAGTFSLTTSGGTQFLRPEDIAWDPTHPSDVYFVTTDRLDQIRDGVGTQVGRSRLWRARFADISTPTLGGTIEMLLDGTEGGNMYDNITIDRHGRLLLQEDVGNAAHLGKIWMYEIATDRLVLLAKHDPARFGDIGAAATAPFNQDEESSGIIDVSSILGDGSFLLDVQAHYPISSASPNGFANPNELVEGGQLLLMRVPPPPTLNRLVFDDEDRGGNHGNDGKFESLTLMLNGTVAADDIAAGAFTLTREHGRSFDLVVDSVVPDGGTTKVTLGFSRNDHLRNALPDGDFTLIVDGAKIKDGLGQAADMDGDGYAGGIRSFSFDGRDRRK